jgi:hypothetical protein
VTLELLLGIWIVELDEEVLIRLPVIVIINSNFDVISGLSFIKIKNT